MSINEVRKRHGILKAIPYGICRVLQKFMVLDVTFLMVKDADNLNPDLNSAMDSRFLNADEVRRFATDPTNDIDPDLAERIDLGYDFCFAGLIDGCLASYCWLARHSIEAQHNCSGDPLTGLALSYPEEYVFRYKGFTHPDFRGQQLYQRVSANASLAMKELGVRYMISTAECVNYGALRSSTRCGYQNLGICIVAGWRGRIFHYTPKSKCEHQQILLGRKAIVMDRDALPAKSSPVAHLQEIPST